MPARVYPLPNIGDIQGDLIVTGIYHDARNNVRIVLKCTKCERERDIYFYTFRRKTKFLFHKMCGSSRDVTKCLSRQNMRFYKIWMGMCSRCYNKNEEHFCYYGGKGITCAEFDLFVDFYDALYSSYLDAILKYGDESQVTLDRIDPNKDYCKENCRWISKFEQEQNKIRNKWFLAISPSGERFFDCNKARFSREHDIKRVTINNCLLYGCINRKGWKFRYLTEDEIKKFNLNDKLTSVKCNDYPNLE